MPAAKPQKKRMALSKKADTLFGKIVRAPQRCEIGYVKGCPSGPYQCCHIFGRSYRGGGLRWDTRNAVCGCAGCHKYYTHHPEEWDVWRRAFLGEELYEELRQMALHGERVDLSEVVAALEARLAEVEAA